MRSCEQMKNLNVLEHGFSVARYFKDLYEHLKYGKSLKYEWKLPDWIYNPELLNHISPLKTLYKYHIYHDCGKPYCLYFDGEGKKHFPNHAEISFQAWSKISDDNEVGELIRKDMDIHLIKSVDIEKFCKSPHSISLLLTGLAEIHSNASMFGGIDSTSFKIKWKHINKTGKRIISYLNL